VRVVGEILGVDFHLRSTVIVPRSQAFAAVAEAVAVPWPFKLAPEIDTDVPSDSFEVPAQGLGG